MLQGKSIKEIVEHPDFETIQEVTEGRLSMPTTTKLLRLFGCKDGVFKGLFDGYDPWRFYTCQAHKKEKLEYIKKLIEEYYETK